MSHGYGDRVVFLAPLDLPREVKRLFCFAKRPGGPVFGSRNGLPGHFEVCALLTIRGVVIFFYLFYI